MCSIPRIELSYVVMNFRVLRKLPEIFMALPQHPLGSHPLALAFRFHGRPPRWNEAGSETSHLIPKQLSGTLAVPTCFTIEFAQALRTMRTVPAEYATFSYFHHISILFPIFEQHDSSIKCMQSSEPWQLELTLGTLGTLPRRDSATLLDNSVLS